MPKSRKTENEALSNFVMCVRNKEKRGRKVSFGTEPGETLYLEVPDGKIPDPARDCKPRTEWLKDLLQRATSARHPKTAKSPLSDYTIGDILVFVHGYNNSIQDVMTRHDLLQKGLRQHGFQGAVVSYDWPSAESTLNYLEDRSDAKATAHRLVEDGIKVLALAQRDQDMEKCDIDVHLLGHSTGAYVIREAFYEASQSRQISRINWNVSQVVFIGADIGYTSMSASNGKSRTLFEHSIRITNYQNPSDSALKMSNVKRLGLAPRIGRVGVPGDAPDNVVNVDVGQHWRTLQQGPGNWSHSWHFYDGTFAEDLVATLIGDVDRNVISTRQRRDGSLFLKSTAPEV